MAAQPNAVAAAAVVAAPVAGFALSPAHAIAGVIHMSTSAGSNSLTRELNHLEYHCPRMYVDMMEREVI